MTGAKRQKPRRARHVPQRTCVVCREKTDKQALTRLVATPDQKVVIDPTGKQNGRGAYICRQRSCWETMVRSTVLDNALKFTIAAENKAALLEKFKQSIEEMSHA